MSSELVPLTDSERHELTSKYARLDVNDRVLIVSLHEAGKPQTEIARIVGCAQSTVSMVLKQVNSLPDAVRKVVRTYTPRFIEDMVNASEVAAKRGDSTPALKALAIAHSELGAQAANSGGGAGVTIVVYGKEAKIGPGDLPIIDVSPAKVSTEVSLSSETLND